MASIKAVFWNEEEARLRAGWRVLLQFILFLVLLIVAAIFDDLLDRILGRLPRHPVFGEADSFLLPVEMLAATLVSMWLAGRFLDRRRFSDFGLRFGPSWWIDLGFGLALGGVLMGGIFMIHLVAGWATITGTLRAGIGDLSFPAGLLLIFVTIVCMATQEELHSRGYQLKNLLEGLHSPRIGPKGAVVLAIALVCAIFGAFHYDADAGLISVFALVLGGLPYVVAFVLTGELAIPIGFHIAWNFCEGCVFGFPVSGTDMGVSLIALSETGPDLWTGGRFGPEAGLLGIGAHLAAVLFIVGWVRWRRGGVRLQERLLEPNLLEGQKPLRTSF
jgi:membrane protease YdiL (CAAX protease family)